MSNLLLKILMILAAISFVACVVMTVMAIRFHEWGRVIFYGVIALLSAELIICGILKLKES